MGTLQLTDEEIKTLSDITVNQSLSVHWLKQRHCRHWHCLKIEASFHKNGNFVKIPESWFNCGSYGNLASNTTIKHGITMEYHAKRHW